MHACTCTYHTHACIHTELDTYICTHFNYCTLSCTRTHTCTVQSHTHTHNWTHTCTDILYSTLQYTQGPSAPYIFFNSQIYLHPSNVHIVTCCTYLWLISFSLSDTESIFSNLSRKESISDSSRLKCLLMKKNSHTKLKKKREKSKKYT